MNGMFNGNQQSVLINKLFQGKGGSKTNYFSLN
jgi:hypothetical protein